MPAFVSGLEESIRPESELRFWNVPLGNSTISQMGVAVQTLRVENLENDHHILSHTVREETFTRLESRYN